MPNQIGTDTGGDQSSELENDFVSVRPDIDDFLTGFHRVIEIPNTTNVPRGLNVFHPQYSNHFQASHYNQSSAQNGVGQSPHTSTQQDNIGAWISTNFVETHALPPDFNSDLRLARETPNVQHMNDAPREIIYNAQSPPAVPVRFNYHTGNIVPQPGLLSGHPDSRVPSFTFSSCQGYPSSVTTRFEDRSIYPASSASRADIASVLSEPQSNQSFKCQLCQRQFSSEKDLRRHKGSATHSKKDSESSTALCYTCCCGYNCPRKDNYKRHLQKVCSNFPFY